jgi:hypothetical protein
MLELLLQSFANSNEPVVCLLEIANVIERLAVRPTSHNFTLRFSSSGGVVIMVRLAVDRADGVLFDPFESTERV